jgi:hypothetical protein
MREDRVGLPQGIQPLDRSQHSRGVCRRIESMRSLKNFIADIRFETEEARAAHEARGLIVHNVTVNCIPVIAPDGEPCIVYTVNGKRATLGQAARQLKEAADAAEG